MDTTGISNIVGGEQQVGYENFEDPNQFIAPTGTVPSFALDD
jgi:hypothetical protein